MGLLDGLSYGSGGGLLDALLRNLQQPQQDSFSGLPSDQAQYAQPQMMPQAMQPSFAPQQLAQPQAPISAPPNPAAIPQNAQPTQGQLPQFSQQAPQQAQQALPPALGGSGYWDRLNNGGGLIGSMLGDTTQQKNLKTQYDLLVPLMGQQKAMLSVLNPKAAETFLSEIKDNAKVENLGSGWIRDSRTGKITRAYTPDDNTPSSVNEYKYYKDNLPPGQQPMDYATFSTAKARAGATNVSNNIDMNSGQTYDKQLAEGLGKAHTALATGVEDAQTRARDIAAMQGAVDAIQKNGGTTGGLGQQQVLDLKKTINNGLSSLGVEKPFNEGDLSDKEFLTKFNRSMAGAQAKGAVGARVTNFEMSNFLKANPGLDMSITGNQRLLGIQAQMEERNIAVGNAIRDATAEAISQGQKINPVKVQGIIKAYDDAHHIKDVVTGQDLTQSYSLPEFQKGDTNASMAKAHSENIKTMEKTIGGTTYVQRNGQWYPK